MSSYIFMWFDHSNLRNWLVFTYFSMIIYDYYLWLSHKDSKLKKNITKRFWVKILHEFAIDFPNIADLILILLAISPGTGPLERSYSKLAKTCFKDRACISSSTLEVLYLLCCLQINNNDEELFVKVREHLQKKT